MSAGWPAAVALGAVALGFANLPAALAAALAGVLVAALLLDRARTARTLARLAARLSGATGVVAAGTPLARLQHAVNEAATTCGAMVSRVGNRHALSGLPTREPLIERIVADSCGTLGIVAITDFDRLCAFDPELGDRVLTTTADRLRRMVSKRTLIAQVDRATFAIWVGGETVNDDSRAQLEAIGYALGDTIAADDQTVRPEIAVRLSDVTPADADPQALLTRTLASLALHPTERGHPRDAVAAARDEYAFEQDVRTAIERNHFHLSYQPLVDASEGRVCGAEALLRWNHPTRGAVSPAQFVPVAEALGLAGALGMWALNAAIKQARTWQRDQLVGLGIAVNVSGHQLEREDFPRLVERTLARHSLSAETLEIELTESVAMGHSDRAVRLLKALREIGVRIAIDDFGTGYSSLSTLRTLSFDKIKIDREFVTNVDTQPDCQAICQSVIALGRGLGIRVLAEGVERREEYEWLRRHGCTHFQGYYFAKPLSAADFDTFVRDRAGLEARLALGPRALAANLAGRITA